MRASWSDRSVSGSAGSALLLALVALLVVSMLGLSVSVVTSLERRLGANRRGAEQALWAAESGLAVAAARILSKNDPSALTVDLGPAVSPTDGGPGLLRIQARLEPVRPLLVAPCGLCQINGAGSYGADAGLVRVHLALASRGQRVSGATGEALISKRVEAILDLEPWPSPDARITASAGGR